MTTAFMKLKPFFCYNNGFYNKGIFVLTFLKIKESYMLIRKTFKKKTQLKIQHKNTWDSFSKEERDVPPSAHHTWVALQEFPWEFPRPKPYCSYLASPGFLAF